MPKSDQAINLDLKTLIKRYAPTPLTGIFHCAFLCFSSFQVHAEPLNSMNNLKRGIAPPVKQWVMAKPVDQAQPAPLSEEDIKDPTKLLAFLKTSPNALDPSRMSPFIAIEVGKTLLYGGEVRKAVQLLNAAKSKWPNDLFILQQWEQALIKSGQPSYVRHGIESWQASSQGQALDGYTQYLYALSIYLEGPQDPRHLSQASSMIDQLLATNPNYVGPDGITAARLQSFKAELQARLSQ